MVTDKDKLVRDSGKDARKPDTGGATSRPVKVDAKGKEEPRARTNGETKSQDNRAERKDNR